MDGGKTHARLHIRPPSRCTMSIVPPIPRPSPGRGRREVPAGSGGRALPKSPPFLESSLPPAAEPGPLVGPPTSPRPPQPYADSPTSFLSFSPYFRSLLEHLGKARSLGNVKRHGQPAGSSSRDRSEDRGGSEEHAQPPGKAACGRLTLFLALQLAHPFPAARSEASREEQPLWPEPS